MEETIYVMSVKSNTNCEADASPLDPSLDPILDFVSGKFVAKWPTS